MLITVRSKITLSSQIYLEAAETSTKPLVMEQQKLIFCERFVSTFFLCHLQVDRMLSTYSTYIYLYLSIYLMSLFSHRAFVSPTMKPGNSNNLCRISSLFNVLLCPFPRHTTDSAIISWIMLTTGKNCKIFPSQ